MPRRRLSGLGDSELEALTRRGDEAAFAELWQRHARAGLAAARQFSSIADPDDIVSEAYLHIFRALQRGGGPSEAFRPYLYRTIRNVALGWIDKKTSVPIDAASELEDPAPDPETTAIRSTITVRAFRTLPERWQTVLWYTEVEGMTPAEAAPFLGMTPNAVAALAYRAREGLKKAWLQAHVNDRRIPDECRWTTEHMGDYVRGSLTANARERFEEHLDSCTRCPIVLEEIDDVNGRLAVVLLPLALGGAAATGLLAARGGAAAPASAAAARGPRMPRSQVRLAAIAVAAGVVATSATVVAVGYLARPAPPSSVDTVDPSPGAGPTHAPAPSDDPTDTGTPDGTGTETLPGTGTEPTPPGVHPTPPGPSAPPTDPGSSTPPPATAPPAPAVASPSDDALTNSSTPTLSGSGSPGSTIRVEYLDGDTPKFLGATAVPAGGLWTITPTTSTPDGVRSFRVTQVRSGLSSTPVVVTITIDTIAEAPIVEPLDPGPLVFLPEVRGTAEPGAAVELLTASGRPLATATASADGSWSAPLPDAALEGESVVARQTDLAGNVSGTSAPTAALAFSYPTLTPADGDSIASTGGATVVTLQIGGIAGNQVEVFIDGVSTGNLHTLGTTPITRVTPALADGSHTLGVRYVDASGRRGPTVTHTVTIAP